MLPSNYFRLKSRASAPNEIVTSLFTTVNIIDGAINDFVSENQSRNRPQKVVGSENWFCLLSTVVLGKIELWKQHQLVRIKIPMKSLHATKSLFHF